ncbi:MAG TPA: DUF4159 domain-containing protein [Methyloceanibacter sp.]|nr:DUF4159 domain-containing protein [Methyloceanibacter sp.]
MMTIGAIGFLQPWVLAALAALPAIWWLLRLTPPSPQVVVFPPTRLLKDLKTTEETPAHSPWWLTALRMLLAALLIFALARPVLNPDQQTFAGEGPLLLVIDNGWASAAHWPERREAIEAAIDRAGRDGRTVLLAFTAPGQPISDPLSPEQARERVGGLNPEPYAPDRTSLAPALEKQLGGKTDYSVLWLSDGLDYGEGDAFAKTLAKLAGSSGSFAVLRPGQDDAALALGQTAGDKGELAARVMSGAEGPRSGVVKALTGRGEPLGEAAFSIAQGKREAIANFDLPLEIRNQVARMEISGERSAGAVHLLDGRSQWHRVGIVSGESREAAQPLLSPLYYVQRALSPYADVITPGEGNVSNAIHSLIEQKVSTIVLADIGKLVAGTQEELEAWLKSGGVLIRFAGPRLEQGGDELLPVALRRGGRSLGGSLSWSTPQPLAPFEEKSPFRGLAVPPDVKINRQVLADPTVASESEVWATLADGTPLVTAAKQGQGFIVLFHVTANSDWSNLPLSGLFVEMLRRVVALGPSQVTIDSGKEASTVEASPAASTAAASSGALPPLQTLDGFGQLGSPPLRAAPISPDKLDTLVPGPDHPPGYYGPSGAARAFNLITAKTVLKPLADVEGSSAIGGYTMKKPVALEPWLYLAAIGLFVIDILAMLVLSGGVRFGRRTAATSAAILLALALLPTLTHSARAQEALEVAPPAAAPAPDTSQANASPAAPEDFALKASLQTHLAYVITGDGEIDRASEEGLSGLSKVLRARTALEPAEPMGVDINKDELAFFPILYWPVREDAQPLSDATLAKVDAFMKQGGLIIFDTRDHETGFSGTGAQGKALTRLIGQLDIPPLEPVPENHVLTKSFYLMHSFPGRWDGGALWVEAEPEDEAERNERSRRTDGVSSIVITSNDFAGAWALDEANRPIYPTVPGGEVQREMAFRAGVNIVMYALTGNYKADQVHVPALLERLGQ